MLALIFAIIGVGIAVVVGVMFYRADVEGKVIAQWVGCILGFTLLVSGGMVWSYHSNERWLTCKVTKLDRGNGSDYRVETSCGTFTNVSAFPRFKFNTDAVRLQGSMTEGGTYRLLVAGKPISNIYDVQPAS